MQENEARQIAIAIEHLIEGTLPADQLEFLERMLLEDSEARALFLDLTQTHAHLRREIPRLQVGEYEWPTVVSRKEQRSSTWYSAIVAACVVVAAMFFWLAQEPQAAKQQAIAELVRCDDATWGASTLATEIGLPLGPGRMRLEQGRAILRFKSGAKVFLGGQTDLELRDELTAVLHSGTVIVEAPESAHGFAVHTPSAIAIDHGTKFAISVDRARDISHLQVLDGEVEIRHPNSGKATMLIKGEAVTATQQAVSEKTAAELSEFYVARSEENNVPLNSIRITTAMGRDATIVKSNAPQLTDPALILVKNCPNEYRRKGYLAFDLSLVKGLHYNHAKLILTLQSSKFSHPTEEPDARFTVYGITAESLDDWRREDLRWDNAPANLDGADEVDETVTQKLGEFEIPAGRDSGQVVLESKGLTDFLKSDTNGIVTLIIVRNNLQVSPFSSPTTFASRRHPTQLPPTLEFELEP
ncbi:hypothetical protein DSM3645_05660 [Blastopirellula marina DSM 3645]|uniref:FecR protein domain-containing protein n=2 Tax=Blastopirellula marina TaxID=124 RepID=A3ZU21_9BACT|nr:hypothetical protein DSM3645_05660 [Blastopirellula marina DSM 3645]